MMLLTFLTFLTSPHTLIMPTKIKYWFCLIMPTNIEYCSRYFPPSLDKILHTYPCHRFLVGRLHFPTPWLWNWPCKSFDQWDVSRYFVSRSLRYFCTIWHASLFLWPTMRCYTLIAPNPRKIWIETCGADLNSAWSLEQSPANPHTCNQSSSMTVQPVHSFTAPCSEGPHAWFYACPVIVLKFIIFFYQGPPYFHIVLDTKLCR